MAWINLYINLITENNNLSAVAYQFPTQKFRQISLISSRLPSAHIIFREKVGETRKNV